MKSLAIIGAGGLGREIRLMVQHINQFRSTWNFIGFFDDGFDRSDFEKHNILGKTNEISRWQDDLSTVIAIADPHIKNRIGSRMKDLKIKAPRLVHPSAIYEDLDKSGEGLILAANSSLTTNITIGSHVFINLNCTIGHDCIIEDYCSIMPGVNISGNVRIKEKSYLGTGVQVLPGLTIGSNVIVGAGAVVTRDIPSNQVVAGVPARRIK